MKSLSPFIEEFFVDRLTFLLFDQFQLDRSLLGEPQDLANAVVFFASDRTSWVTGQTLSVDGGYAMVS